MNVDIRAEAAQFPEKEYINGIAFAVQAKKDGLDTVPDWRACKATLLSGLS
jgi:hypothetical protein